MKQQGGLQARPVQHVANVHTRGTYTHTSLATTWQAAHPDVVEIVGGVSDGLVLQAHRLDVLDDVVDKLVLLLQQWHMQQLTPKEVHVTSGVA